jgi:hypothetical protein
MSRISRYQESIEKFIKNKNINEYFSESYSKIIYDNLIKSDHLGGIIVSTIFNHNTKKTNFKGHGYFIGLMIDIIIMIVKSKDKDSYINYNLFIGLYKLLTENINLIKTTKHDVLNKIIIIIMSYFNDNIYDILIDIKVGETQKMIKSDLLNLKSIDDKIYKKLSMMNKYDNDDFIAYITKIYGKLGKLIFVISWVLGGGDTSKDTIKSIETIGEQFGILQKICYDFESIATDINDMDKDKYKSSKNIVINIGIQESFALFMETKSIFYEESYKLDVYTHTMKEVIDELENKIDKVLENCKIDIKSVYSSFTK